MLDDLRLAVRALAKAPAFALAAVLCIALGIGANTAIFSVVDAVLLRPLPVRDLDRMVVIREDLPKLDLLDAELDPPSTLELATRGDLFERAAGVAETRVNLTTDAAEPARVGAARTLGDYFQLLDAHPVVGRLYAADQSRDGRHRVVVLSYGFWRDRFGGDRAIVGRTLHLSGTPYEVIGVAGPELRYPRAAEVWMPYPVDSTTQSQHGVLVMKVVAKRRADVSAERLRDALARQGRAWGEALAGNGGGNDFARSLVIRPVPLTAFLAGELRPIVLLLAGAVGLVLLIACANVACLQLVRATGRVRELAVRAALGAGSARLVRPLVAESAAVAAIGGALGAAGGAVAVAALARWGPAQYPMLRDARLDPLVLLFAFALAAASALLFGVAPAVRASRVDPQDALRASARGTSAGAERHRFLQGAVVMQVALALALLLSSGLMIRSLSRLIATDPGFRAERVLTAQVALPPRVYQQAAVAPFVDRLLERLRAVPGVQAVGIAASLPFVGSGTASSSPFEVVGRAPDASGEKPHANFNMVSDDYFRAMGMTLKAGRAFAATDAKGAPPVVVVDEQLARQFFPGESAIGKHLRQLGGVGDGDLTIVGVVGDVTPKELGQERHATIYYTYRQTMTPSFGVAVRGVLPPASFAGALRAIVAEQDRQVPVYDVRPMRERVDESLGARRLAVWVLGAFAALALTLALLGITGVLSYTVSQRAHELGIRLAIGAQRGDIVRLVVRQGATLTLAGLGAGLALFLAGGRLLAAALYGVGPHDPATIVASATLLGTVALVASWLPARRAARADATSVLRQS
ncbi:permease [Gemmatirosa kalamazoonensis]|uniref:Permease n=1 Tax=Gemmatirosa kalamazoonensis TaxID=861299 RepID=W0RHE9_9BACT|nr:ABC transporter permease [Gemmatirosa kalamazoonensis]AHG88828.1 permease [Gemmatirosa kalamazoonensis]